MDLDLLKDAAKYGLIGLLLVYLIYFLTTTMSQKLDQMIDYEQHSQQIHMQMLDTLKEIRDQDKHQYSLQAPPSLAAKTAIIR